MDIENPKIWKIGENLRDILEEMKSASGGDMFRTVSHGFATPDTKAADKLPLACILPPERGRFQSQNGLSVDTIKMTMPIYAYFHLPKPQEAMQRLYRFIQQLSQEIQDMNFSWFDDTVSIIPGDFAIGDILKSTGDRDMKLKPPFYGVHLDLEITINDSSI